MGSGELSLQTTFTMMSAGRCELMRTPVALTGSRAGKGAVR
jgi:hypothetical protein